jgi:hypothetical protein
MNGIYCIIKNLLPNNFKLNASKSTNISKQSNISSKEFNEMTQTPFEIYEEFRVL